VDLAEELQTVDGSRQRAADGPRQAPAAQKPHRPLHIPPSPCIRGHSYGEEVAGININIRIYMAMRWQDLLPCLL